MSVDRFEKSPFKGSQSRNCFIVQCLFKKIILAAHKTLPLVVRIWTSHISSFAAHILVKCVKMLCKFAEPLIKTVENEFLNLECTFDSNLMRWKLNFIVCDFAWNLNFKFNGFIDCSLVKSFLYGNYDGFSCDAIHKHPKHRRNYSPVTSKTLYFFVSSH